MSWRYASAVVRPGWRSFRWLGSLMAWIGGWRNEKPACISTSSASCCMGNPNCWPELRQVVCRRYWLKGQVKWKWSAQLLSLTAHQYCTYLMTLGFCFCKQGDSGLLYTSKDYGFLKYATHYPFTNVSNLAPACRLAESLPRRSSITGCRLGSTQTLLHTSVSSMVVMLCISLCLIEGGGACSTQWSVSHKHKLGACL